MNAMILTEYENFLSRKGFKKRASLEYLRSARDFLSYLELNDESFQFVRLKTAIDYRNFLSHDKNYKAVTINKVSSNLKHFYSFLLEINLVSVNPYNNLDRMKEGISLKKNILKISEIKKLLDNVPLKTKRDFRLKVILELLYSTGVRINELDNLQLKDIDLDLSTILIRDDKERQNRLIPLTEIAQHLLGIYIKAFDIKESKEYIFRQGRERSLNRWVNDHLKRLTKQLRLPKITCHGFRHSIATHLLQSGAGLREVQRFLGHKKIKNTEIYTALDTEDLRNTVLRNHPRETFVLKVGA